MLADGAIGGYFPLAMPERMGRLHDGVLGFQSARAAFLALLRHVRPKRVWLPRYLCPAMLKAVHATGIEARLYSLRDDFSPIGVIAEPSDLVLAVDYFGLTRAVVSAVLRDFGGSRVIVDAAAAIFTYERKALATIYSPRKFLGLPDGGWLATNEAVPLPGASDDGSPDRCLGLLMRTDRQVERGHAAYQDAERSLDELVEPVRTSWLTETLASYVDWASIKGRRRANYAELAAKLRDISKALPLDDGAPLCFPLIGVDALRLRPVLAAQRIYTPTYWPDIIDAENLNEFELTLRDRTLYLPIDQRYGTEDMARLASIVRDLVQNNARSV